MEIVLAALAEAILSLIIEDIAQRPRLSQLREKLRGDSPEKLALQHALAKTYRAFAEHYPQLAFAFFDEHFLSKPKVVAELAKLLTPDKSPNPQALIDLWHAQFHSAPSANIENEIGFFLATLGSEIKSQPALKPFTDSRAFEQLYAIAEGTQQQLAEQRTTNEHLIQINTVLADVVLILREKLPGIHINMGGGSIIGDNVETQGGGFSGRDSIVGNTTQSFDSHTHQTGDTVANPFTDRGRINDPNRFFVRQPIVRELQQALAAGNSIALIGESGVGKSSLLKYLELTQSQWLPNHEVIYLDLYSVFSEIDFCSEVLHVLNPLLTTKLRNTNDALITLKRTVRGRNLLLMLDEIERMADRDFTPRLQGLLRALLQDGNLILLVASKLPIEKVFPPSNPTSPLHNVFSNKILSYFNQYEMQDFVQQRLAGTHIQFHVGELDSLWQSSYGHPNQIQRSAEFLFNSKSAKR